MKTKSECMTKELAEKFIKLVHSSNGADVLFAKMCFEVFEKRFDDDYYLSECKTELSYALQRLEQFIYKYKQLPE